MRTVELEMDHGDDFEYQFTVIDPRTRDPVDITLFTPEGQVRDANDSTGTLLATLSGEVLDGPNGIGRFYLLGTTSSSYTFTSGYVHLRIKSGSRRILIAKGTVVARKKIIA